MTHPQILTGGINDMCTKYDTIGNYSRAIRTGALEGEEMRGFEAEPAENGATFLRHPLNGWTYERLEAGRVLVTTTKGVSGTLTANADWVDGELKDANPHLCLWVGGLQLDAGRAPGRPRDPAVADAIRDKLGPNASPSALSAEMQRQALAGVVPPIAEPIPDIELSASIFMTVFPNWHPWGSFNLINYRFRPNGDNHDECIMECMYLASIPEVGEYQPASEIHWLGVDEDWTHAPELGMLGKIFNQDLRNLPNVYEGLKATAREHVRLGDYNELKIRHFHELYGRIVGDP
jgi:hypothetical protein